MHGSKKIIGAAGPTSISLIFIKILSFISLLTNLHGWFVEERVCVFGPKEIQMVEIVVRHSVMNHDDDFLMIMWGSWLYWIRKNINFDLLDATRPGSWLAIASTSCFYYGLNNIYTFLLESMSKSYFVCDCWDTITCGWVSQSLAPQ